MGWATGSAVMWLLTGTAGLWALTALMVRALFGGERPQSRSADPLGVLRERLARGDISPEDFEHRRRLVTDGHTMPPPQDGLPRGRTR